MTKKYDDDSSIVWEYPSGMKTLVTPSLKISYTKARYTKGEEGAAFVLEGSLKTPDDRRKAAHFIGEALKDPSLHETAWFTSSSGDRRPLSLDANRDFSFPSTEE